VARRRVNSARLFSLGVRLWLIANLRPDKVGCECLYIFIIMLN
jgi:hypothetical protein